ncbi:GntR family transcriptional regulator [Advenella kashmirensis]
MNTQQSGLSTIRPTSLADQVHAQVQHMIAAGRFAPGTAINIAQLSRQCGVSHTPIREALARLAAEGQLIFVRNIGYRLPEPPTIKQYTDWAVARVVVESNALLYILGPIDLALIDKAQQINDQIRQSDFGKTASGIRRFSELNWRFHATLIGLADNAMLEDAHSRLYASPQFSRIFLGRGVINQNEVAVEHERVLACLRDGDRQAAAQALRDHIVDSLERDAQQSHISGLIRRTLNGRLSEDNSGTT